MTPTELSKKVFRTKQAITFAVKMLDAAGLVKRQPLSSDLRIRRIRITEKSLTLVKNTLESRRNLIYGIMSCLKPEEAEALFQLLEKLMENMPKQSEPARKRRASPVSPES